MQSRRTAPQQVFTQLRHNVYAVGLDAGDIVTKTLQPLAQPARYLRTTVAAEACQVAEIGDGHDAGHDWHLYPQLLATFPITEIGLRIVEVLGDGAVGTGIDLLLEEVQVLF